jgi:hypothetical protein
MKRTDHRSQTVRFLVLLTVILAAGGCRKKEDYRERYLELRKRHKEQIALLTARHKSERQQQEKEIDRYRSDLSALKKKLSRTEELRGRGGALSRTRSPLEQAAAVETPSEEPESPPGIPAGTPFPSPGEVEALERFLEEYAPRVDTGKVEKFKEDFSAYIARRREEPAVTTAAERRESALEDLGRKLDETTDDRERGELERRIEKIENAGEDDLAGVLDYYRKMDDFRELHRLMDEFNISRGDLIESGVTPPPQDSWRPDPRDTAYNLRRFVESYEPLTDESRRDQYREDFQQYLDKLVARPSDGEALRRRDQLVDELKAGLENASAEERTRLERRIERIRNSGVEELRSMVVAEKLRELGDLVEKYGLPRDELRQSGVLLRRGGGASRTFGPAGRWRGR